MITRRVCARRAWFAERVGVVATCAAALAALPATAALADPPRLELGVFGGAFAPDDRHEFYDPHDTLQKKLDRIGPDYGLRVAFFPFGFAGVEGEADIMPQETGAGAGVLLFGARGHVVLQLPGRVTPFALVGLGTMGVRSDADVLSNDADTVAHIGVGAKLAVGERLSLRADGRLYRAPRTGDDGGTNHYAALFGASYAIGRLVRERPVTHDVDLDGVADAADACPRVAGVPPDGCPAVADSDGDGLANDQDRCPSQPETLNGFDDEDGCPDELPDRDGDRVVDAGDACPDEPEDVDGFQDDDGCPDGDNDGDQIADAEDRCPGEAGPSANQGCPDTDRDQDSVVDRLDNCPDEAGTPDHQGCKDAQLVAIAPDRVRPLEPITFATDRVQIRRRSLLVLDNLAAVLTRHPELTHIRIAGYTDDRGGADHNKELSQRRAEEVRTYLVGRGVAAERLEAIGFGEERPLEPNTRAVGRAANRRVEFEIVRPGVE